ncbi:hypothetical protein B0G62_11247 [Paraburkholderia eburnea]|uniref:Uncharacterized protein n=1 Tax=Paraburkholderia eburnea TaxID=1189126 RepID=A0A2S4M346_9BURK|nr:hypothetical protein [Paraburkholderia eburnea]POR49065.1 hypothetical protein B0G62_11247 [Paraburkholderia eburnea]PRZ19442.1 hypothetical protein BX588_11547 [Paraburkholderia eburnea]
MANHPPYSVVLTYSEERQQLTVQTVDRNRLAPHVAGKLEMPILLDEYDFKLDDEFARRLGVAVLNLIALGQPDIRQYMSVTQQPKE